MQAMAGRLDQSLPVGNEGAGVVVDTGAAAKRKRCAARPWPSSAAPCTPSTAASRRTQCLVLPEGTTPREGASCFVNPLTALGMVETMRLEGHSALVHTAAASNLGQMLNRICSNDGVALVNIVRRAEQAELLQEQGARHVWIPAPSNFMPSSPRRWPTPARPSPSTPSAAASWPGRSSLHGSGGQPQRHGATAATAPTCTSRSTSTAAWTAARPILNRNFGMAWGIGGWLLPPFLAKIGPEAAQKLRERVAAEIKTTFASHYTREVSLAEALVAGRHRAVRQAGHGGEVPDQPAEVTARRRWLTG